MKLKRNDSDDAVTMLGEVLFVKSNGAGWRVRFDGASGPTDVWLHSNTCEPETDYVDDGDQVEFMMPKWLARKEGLI